MAISPVNSNAASMDVASGEPVAVSAPALSGLPRGADDQPVAPDLGAITPGILPEGGASASNAAPPTLASAGPGLGVPPSIVGDPLPPVAGHLLPSPVVPAVPEPAEHATGVAGAARQSIQNDVFKAAKNEAAGIASDDAERHVDKMLFDVLPKIGFSEPGERSPAGEIGDFILSMGHDVPSSGLACLQGVSNEAATALPTEDDKRSNIMIGLMRLLTDVMHVSEDGKLDAAERDGVPDDVAGLMQKLRDDGGE
jgi:hypothetical protein